MSTWLWERCKKIVTHRPAALTICHQVIHMQEEVLL